MRLKAGEVKERTHLADLLNQRGLTFWGVEVGTDRGVFAKQFLQRWEGDCLCCVDPWEDYMDGYKDDIFWPRSPDMLLTIAALAPFHDRVRILRMTSEQAAKTPMPLLDFVYIDANHDYEFVRRDIELWWPNVKRGGMLAGHDYCHNHSGVIRAVDEFMIKQGINGSLTAESSYQSWFCFKP